MVKWSGGLSHWVDDAIGTAYISVAFSWKLQEAYQWAVFYKAQGYQHIRAGGPGLFVRNNFLNDVAEVGGEIDALIKHNPDATIASRGCPVGCSFCIVPAMEGKTFKLLPDFTPRPILCDNNLSALPAKYQDHIIEKYIKSDTLLLDANSGFEPITFTRETYLRWKEINKGPWRFAFDEIGEENDVVRVSKFLSNVPSYKKRVYVLIGNEPFETCMERIYKVIELGCEPYVQPMMALNTLVKKPLIRHDWSELKLMDVARWANRWIWRSVLFDQYKSRKT